MHVRDITVPLRPEMPTWPGGAGYSHERTLDQERGDAVTNSTITMDVHCGTHIDAPLHFLPDGDSIDTIDIEACVGPAYVADLRGVRSIGPSDLEASVPPGVTRLLLKTDNGSLWLEPTFEPHFVALTSEGAEWVARRGCRLIANDYLSVQLFGGDPRTHTILMQAGVVILEGVDLSLVDPGHYELLCLPLRLVGVEAAPARAVLIQPEMPVA